MGLRSPGKKVAQRASALQGLARNREIEKDRKERQTDMGTKALMEQRCFNQHGVCIYTILQGGYSQQRQRLKFQTYKTSADPYQRERVANINFYHLAHKKEEGTYHCNEKCLDSSAPGKACFSS